MAIKYLSDINLNKNQLQSARLHNLATAPSATATDIGFVYYNTTDNKVYVWDGTAWFDVSGDIKSISSSTTNQLSVTSGTGPNPSLAINTGAVTDDATTLTTGTQVYDFIYADAQRISVAGTGNEVTVLTSNTDSAKLQLGDTLTIGLPDDVTIGRHLTVTGNLVVNGATTSVNSTTVTIDDPVFTLGGDTAPSTDDNKDRGIEFRYHDGTDARLGFFGYDDSKQRFSFLTAATNNSEVFSGTDAAIDISDIRMSGVIKSYAGAAPTNGQILIGSTTNSDMQLSTLTEGDGIDITNAGNTITISAETATDDNAGIVELATAAETLAGAAADKVVTPAGLAARSFNATIGDASATAFTVTHSLSTKDVIAQVYEISTGDTIFTDISRPTVQNIQLNFATAPAANSMRVLVTKID